MKPKDSDQGFLFLIQGEPLPTLEVLLEKFSEKGYESITQHNDTSFLSLKLNDCVLPFQRVKRNDDTSFIGGAILPYVSKRNMIDNLLLLGLPFLIISFVSLLLYIGSYIAALLHGFNILSMPVDTIDFLLQWMPATSLGFALLFLIPAAPSIILPLINSRTLRSIQTDLTTTIRGICESLEIAEFKRHHIWQDTRIPKHVSQNIAEAVKMMPSCEHKDLIQRLGRP